MRAKFVFDLRLFGRIESVKIARFACKFIFCCSLKSCTKLVLVIVRSHEILVNILFSILIAALYVAIIANL